MQRAQKPVRANIFVDISKVKKHTQGNHRVDLQFDHRINDEIWEFIDAHQFEYGNFM